MSLEKGVPFYFSPFVYSARGKMRAQGDTLVIEPGHYLYLIDGMHRTSALLAAISYLETEANDYRGNQSFSRGTKIT